MNRTLRDGLDASGCRGCFGLETYDKTQVGVNPARARVIKTRKEKATKMLRHFASRRL